jgi:hypothetical protein
MLDREHLEVAAQKLQCRHHAALLCGSGLLALVKRLLPIAPVKIIVFGLAQINAFEASHVDVERLRIGARYIERCDATIRTEEMPRGFRVERVRGDVVRLREQPERAARDDPVDVAFLRANRAVAFGDAVERTSNLEADAPAMASAAIGPLDDLLFGLLLFRRFLRGRLFLHRRFF